MRRIAYGALAGLVAALVVTVVMLALRLLVGLPLPVELVSDRFLPLVPVDLFLELLGTMGGPIMAKKIAFYSGFANQLALGVLLGALYAALSTRDRPARRVPRIVWVVLGVWLVTLAALWPALDSSYVGLPPGRALVVSALGFLLYASLFAVTLVALHRGTDGARA